MKAAPGIPLVWGVSAQEAEAPFPCDGLIDDPDHVYFRGVSIAAEAPVVFRWLCQLKAAPYSYDWIDNFGRRSPPRLIPGLEDLRAGQRVMTIFTLSAFGKDEHLTLVMDTPWAVAWFGHIAITYRVSSAGPRASRLVAKLLVRYGRDGRGRLMRAFLPWGDWLMMRKQLLVLKGLSERGPRAG